MLLLFDTLIPPYLREEAVALMEAIHEAREPQQLIREGDFVRCVRLSTYNTIHT